MSDQLGCTNSGMQESSPEHYHITCEDVDKEKSNGIPSYLNGYNIIDGKIISVWTSDTIELLGIKSGTQLSLIS
jgi:hypothetical protein